MDDKTEVGMVQEIGTYERHFNQIQSNYRTIASGWLLAAFTGVGYLLTHKGETSLSLPMPALIGGICLAVSIGVMLIWILDLKVYHRLLVACFDAGMELEVGRPYLADIRRRMDANKVSVRRGLYLFYIGALGIMFVVGIGAQFVLPYPPNDETGLNVHPSAIYGGFALVALLGALLAFFSRETADGQRRRSSCGCGNRVPTMSTATRDGRICKFDELADWQKDLVEAACKASMNAYNPYSGLAVGAALMSDIGKPGAKPEVYTATNLENASYSLTICAERAAVAKAVSEGVREFRAIALIAHGKQLHHDELLTPCGACRQVLFEFADLAQRELEVIVSSPDRSQILVTTVDALLPHAVKRKHIGRT